FQQPFDPDDECGITIRSPRPSAAPMQQSDSAVRTNLRNREGRQLKHSTPVHGEPAKTNRSRLKAAAKPAITMRRSVDRSTVSAGIRIAIAAPTDGAGVCGGKTKALLTKSGERCKGARNGRQ